MAYGEKFKIHATRKLLEEDLMIIGEAFGHHCDYIASNLTHILLEPGRGFHISFLYFNRYDKILYK